MLDYHLLPMHEGVTSNRNDFVNTSTSQSACKAAEKSELFHLNICLQGEAWKHPATAAGILCKDVSAVPWVIALIFCSGLNLPFKRGEGIKCLIKFQAGRIGITLCQCISKFLAGMCSSACYTPGSIGSCKAGYESLHHRVLLKYAGNLEVWTGCFGLLMPYSDLIDADTAVRFHMTAFFPLSLFFLLFSSHK